MGYEAALPDVADDQASGLGGTSVIWVAGAFPSMRSTSIAGHSWAMLSGPSPTSKCKPIFSAPVTGWRAAARYSKPVECGIFLAL